MNKLVIKKKFLKNNHKKKEIRKQTNEQEKKYTIFFCWDLDLRIWFVCDSCSGNLYLKTILGVKVILLRSDVCLLYAAFVPRRLQAESYRLSEFSNCKNIHQIETLQMQSINSDIHSFFFCVANGRIRRLNLCSQVLGL